MIQFIMDELKLDQQIDRCELFSCLKKDEREEYIKNCSDECIHSLCEIYYNIITGGLYMPPRNMKKVNEILDPFPLYTQKFIDPEVRVCEKRKLLSNPQFGNGIFSLLSSAILPVLIGLLSK